MRDVAPPLAIEHRDVLGLVARARVGEAAESPRADLGDQIARRRDERPAVAAEIGQIDLKRAREVFVEDFGCAPQVGRDDGARHERLGAELRLESRKGGGG